MSFSIMLFFNTPPGECPEWETIRSDNVPNTIEDVKRLAASEQGWFRMDMWTRNSLTLARVQLYLIPEPEPEESPDVIPALETMVKLSIDWKLRPAAEDFNCLVDHPLIKDQPFASEYAGGLPSGARIVAVLPQSGTRGPGAPTSGPFLGGNLVRNLPNPSAVASSTATQAGFVSGIGPLPRVRCGRPADSGRPWAPLPIVHEAFAAFYDTLNATASLDPEVFRLAARLMESMSMFYPNEIARTDVLLPLLSGVIGLGVDIIRTQHGRSIATTNGSLTVKNTVMLSVEVKERKSPSRQNDVYAIQRSGISAGDHNEAVHKSAAHLAVEPHLPMLLIDIHDGVIMSVRGAYFAPPSLVTSVLAVASMVADDISGPTHFHLARVLCALRISARTLHGRYSLVNTAIQTAAVMRDVVNSVQVIRPVQFGNRVAVCKRELMPRRLTFTAECETLSVYNPDGCGTATIIKEGRWPAQFVLKYAREKYGIAQHLAAANVGAAPALLGYRSLPGGFVCIAMELLDNTWKMYNSETASREEREAALHFYSSIFGGNGFVHGDLRTSNVMIHRDSTSGRLKIMFLDFGRKCRGSALSRPAESVRVDPIGPT
jgi:hypothetical protein